MKDAQLPVVGQFELNGQLLMGPRAPSPATRRRRASSELLIKFSRFALIAGEGARGPSKSGYMRPNLEFQTDPLPNYRSVRLCRLMRVE